MIDFETLQQALDGLDASADAAEAHGMLCALLVGNGALALWLAQILESIPESGDVLARERIELLGGLYRDTRNQMNDEALEFELMLPAENENFALRLAALSSWCEGFVYGLGAAGLAGGEGLDDEARECLSDLIEISKLRDDEEGGDEAELQFTQIAEHVRMAALLINELLNPLKPSNLH